VKNLSRCGNDVEIGNGAVSGLYSNSFTDRLKQDAMNLFLGHYIPNRQTVPL